MQHLGAFTFATSHHPFLPADSVSASSLLYFAPACTLTRLVRIDDTGLRKGNSALHMADREIFSMLQAKVFCASGILGESSTERLVWTSVGLCRWRRVAGESGLQHTPFTSLTVRACRGHLKDKSHGSHETAVDYKYRIENTITSAPKRRIILFRTVHTIIHPTARVMA